MKGTLLSDMDTSFILFVKDTLRKATDLNRFEVKITISYNNSKIKNIIVVHLYTFRIKLPWLTQTKKITRKKKTAKTSNIT